MHGSKIAMLAVALAALGACARERMQGAADAPVAPAEMDRAAGAAARSASPPEAPTPPVQAQMQSAALVQQDAQRKFIRTASARFRVRDVYASAWSIEDLVAQYGGFVTRDAIDNTIEGVDSSPAPGNRIVELATYTLHADLQVRVPSARTQEFLRALSKEVDFLDNRDFRATDAQFDLLRQQLAFARGQQAQAALGVVAAGPGKAGDRSDALAARADAQATRDEALVAQREFEDRIAFSTIDLSLYQPPQVKRSERIDVRALVREERPGFFHRLGHSMASGWSGFLDVVVALATLWPLWLALALALAGVRILRMRRGARDA